MKLNERTLIQFSISPKSPPDKEGWLFKRGEVNKSFQQRYFVLKGNLLYYFEKRLDKEPAGLIILEGKEAIFWIQVDSVTILLFYF